MEILRSLNVNDWKLTIAFNKPEKLDGSENSGESVAAPGTGKYTISQIKLASNKISPGKSLKLSVSISGENMAYLYIEIYYKDQELDYYFGPVMQEYVRSKNEKESHGLVHPVWEPEIILSLSIKPGLRLLTDGQNAAFAFMQSIGYNQRGGLLEGEFTRENSVNTNRARLRFDDSGVLIDKRIIQERKGRLITRDLAIKSGDQFVPEVHVLSSLNTINPKMTMMHGQSNMLTKTEEPFHWVDEAPLLGDYLLALVIEDFNGDKTRHFVPFTIGKDQE